MRKRRLIELCVASIFLSLIFSCKMPESAATSLVADLQITVGSTARSRALDPGLDLTIASYDISGAGPSSETFSLPGVQGATATAKNLRTGSWTVTATGKNAAGTAITQASKNVNVVAGNTANVNITCILFPGNGYLYLGFSWPSGQIQTPEVVATLTPLGSTVAQNLIFTSAATSTYYQNTSLASGYYTLVLKLNESSGTPRNLWGHTETILIITGNNTSGNWILYPTDLSLAPTGGMTVGLASVTNPPLGVTLADASSSMVRGGSISLSASATAQPDSWQWYLNGTPIANATLSSITLGSDLAAGPYSIDVVAQKGVTTGSAGSRFRVVAPSVNRVAKIAAGDAHSLILMEDGSLWAFGLNNYGQLGDGTNLNKFLPIKVMTSVRSIAACGNRSFAIKTDDSLWAFGYNGSGELGDGSTTNRSSPVQIMSEVQSVGPGSNHTLVVKKDATLYAFGDNSYSQLGDGTTTSSATPIQVLSDVQAVAAGCFYSLVLKTDGNYWGFGNNASGQLGDGSTTNRVSPTRVSSGIAKIAAGIWSSYFIKTDGTLWAFGNNGCGQLGDGSTADRKSPVNIMSDISFAIPGSGQLYTLALKTDGSLMAFGYNGSGQLGDGSTTNSLSPKMVMNKVKEAAAGSAFSLVLRTDGTLWSFGSNASGQLGDGTTTNRLLPVLVQVE